VGSVNKLLSKSKRILNDSDLDIETKANELKDLEGQYIQEKTRLNSLTSAISGVNTYGKPIHLVSI